MGQWVFDAVRSKARHFIQEGPCHGPEALYRHLIRFERPYLSPW